MIRQTNSGRQTDGSMDRQTDRNVEGEEGVGRLARQTNSGIQTDEQTNGWREAGKTNTCKTGQIKWRTNR